MTITRENWGVRSSSASNPGSSEQLASQQPTPAVVQPHQEGSNLVFLSARPESYKVRGRERDGG